MKRCRQQRLDRRYFSAHFCYKKIIQVVKVRGDVNSYPSNALPVDGNEPAFANFYVKGGKDALEERMKVFHGVDEEVTFFR